MARSGPARRIPPLGLVRYLRSSRRRPARPLRCTRVEALAHLLAGVEHQIVSCPNLDRIAGSRVTADTRPSCLGRESAETPQLDAITARQPGGDLGEEDLDRRSDIALVDGRVGVDQSPNQLIASWRVVLRPRLPCRRAYGRSYPRYETSHPDKRIGAGDARHHGQGAPAIACLVQCCRRVADLDPAEQAERHGRSGSARLAQPTALLEVW